MSALLPADKVAGINGATHWCRAVSRFPFIVIFISVGVRSCNCQHLGLLRWWPPKKNIHLYLDCRKKESWKWSKWSNGANRWLSILLYSPFRCYWEKKFPLWLTFVKQSKFGVFPRKVNGETLGPEKKKYYIVVLDDQDATDDSRVVVAPYAIDSGYLQYTFSRWRWKLDVYCWKGIKVEKVIEWNY